MKIVRCIGGLGNQMFQYAFYVAMKAGHSETYFDISSFDRYNVHNGFELSNIFGVEFESPSLIQRLTLSFHGGGILSTILRRIFPNRSTEFRENGLRYHSDVFTNDKSRYYIGYWQSWKYFNGIEDIIKWSFTFDETLLPAENVDILSKIEKTNSVSIHIRRGDYINNPVYSGIATSEYYKNAVIKIASMVDNPSFFIFTNDSKWCRSNIDLPNSYIIDNNVGEKSYWDMFLMSRCRHNIIANSSFSWWGAWLNENKSKIVIAPNKWVNLDNTEIEDILLSDWIKL